MKKSVVIILGIVFLVLFLVPGILAAVDFNQDLTPEEQQSFDGILEPVMKVYRFIQYAATVVGVLMLVFAGISFATSGGEMVKKERAKQMAAGVVIGLILIWVAPLIVSVITK
ncbi:MAG: TrbC/VirB2 family protein [Nanoarchaeota archaeon]